MAGPDRPRVSVIITVRNEEASIARLLTSIRSQTQPPDEIVIVDGGSTDRTLEVITAEGAGLPLTMLQAPEVSISKGRNLAMARTTGDVIAVTDAGVELDPRWLEQLVQPLRRDPALQPDVVSGFFRAAPESLFELALGATTLPDPDEIRADQFLPSSRSVAFRRSWYEAGMRYPEWLDFCEDLIFDLRLRRAGARFEFQPAAMVLYRPRPTARAFWRQYFQYARGDGKAGLFAQRHAIRYGTYLGFLPLLLLRRRGWLALLGLAGATWYMWLPWRRLWRQRGALGPRHHATAVAMTLVLRLLGDLAKMGGYPAGLLWRWKHYGVRWTWHDIPEEAGSGTCADQSQELVAQELGRP